MKNIVKEKSPFRKGIFFEINKIKWIKKAVTKFRQNSAFRKADHLKKIHFQIIGDVINNEKQMQSNKSREKLNKVF